MGPLANPAGWRRWDFVQDALALGATVAAGGERIGAAGNFFAPTVLTGVPPDAKVFNEEPFGPLRRSAASRRWTGGRSRRRNRLSFGLAGYAFTRSLKNAHRLAHELEVGMLWWNQPATPSAEMPSAASRDSGHGTEGGPEALDAYLNTRG